MRTGSFAIPGALALYLAAGCNGQDPSKTTKAASTTAPGSTTSATTSTTTTTTSPAATTSTTPTTPTTPTAPTTTTAPTSPTPPSRSAPRTGSTTGTSSTGGSTAPTGTTVTPTTTAHTVAAAIAAGRVLELTDTGSDVQEVQKALNLVGFPCGPADGIFGPDTQTAVVAFQQAHGLVGDGLVGQKTRDALVADLHAGTVAPDQSGTLRCGVLWTGTWTESNAASGSVMGSGSGTLRILLCQDASGKVTGAVKLIGGITGGQPVVYAVTTGTCDASGRLNFKCNDQVSLPTSPTPITTLQFVGTIVVGASQDKISGTYYVTGSAYPGNAGYFTITR